jgi:hypothetical protein
MPKQPALEAFFGGPAGKLRSGTQRKKRCNTPKEVTAKPTKNQVNAGIEAVTSSAIKAKRSRDRVVTEQKKPKKPTKVYCMSSDTANAIQAKYPDVYEWTRVEGGHLYLQCKCCKFEFQDKWSCCADKVKRHVMSQKHLDNVEIQREHAAQQGGG